VYFFENFEIASISTEKKHFLNSHTYKDDIGQYFHKSEKYPILKLSNEVSLGLPQKIIFIVKTPYLYLTFHHNNFQI